AAIGQSSHTFLEDRLGVDLVDAVAGVQRILPGERCRKGIRFEQGLYRPGILPVALEHSVDQPPLAQVVVEKIRDLELASSRGLKLADHFEDRRLEEIDPDRNQIALRGGRLLFEPNDASSAVELCHSKTLRIRHL